jgi:DNA polymerase
MLGGRRVTLYPLYHPAAALYTPTMLEVLERDVARLPQLLAGGEAGRIDSAHARVPVTDFAPPAVPRAEGRQRQPVQLGLF